MLLRVNLLAARSADRNHVKAVFPSIPAVMMITIRWLFATLAFEGSGRRHQSLVNTGANSLPGKVSWVPLSQQLLPLSPPCVASSLARGIAPLGNAALCCLLVFSLAQATTFRSCPALLEDCRTLLASVLQTIFPRDALPEVSQRLLGFAVR